MLRQKKDYDQVKTSKLLKIKWVRIKELGQWKLSNFFRVYSNNWKQDKSDFCPVLKSIFQKVAPIFFINKNYWQTVKTRKKWINIKPEKERE